MSAKIKDLYGEGDTGKLLRQRYRDPVYGNPTKKVAALLQKRHEPRGLDDDNVYRAEGREWKVPIGLAYAWRNPLRRHQMVVLHPWYVTWHSHKDGRRLKKEFQSLPYAVHFLATRAQFADPHAAVVAKHTYDIIPPLRGKLPRTHNGVKYYWCPLCVTARPFYPLTRERTFYAMVKTWVEEKGRYVWTDRTLRVLACRVCGCTNANASFRRSNQPWEKRTFKQGVRRARRRKRRRK